MTSFLEPLRTLVSIPSILRAVRLPPDANSTMAFRAAASSGAFPPLQLESEFVPFMELLGNERLSVILEIGTCKGGTLFLFSRLLHPAGHVISIDLPGGPFGGGYPSWKRMLFASFAKQGRRMTLIRGDSHESKTVQEFESVLLGRPVDLLFIDGDHTLKGVSDDFELYHRYVKAGGIIAIHDIVKGAMAGDVHTFWNSIKRRYRHREFVQDWNQGSCGIGVLWMDRHGT